MTNRRDRRIAECDRIREQQATERMREASYRAAGFIETNPDKCVIWSPPGDCMALSKALNALVLYPGMSPEERREAIDCFNHMKQGALVISTQYGVQGYRIGPATVFFLDGCPDDEAWRAQARARAERCRG